MCGVHRHLQVSRLSLCYTLLFFSASPDMGVPYAFIELRKARLVRGAWAPMIGFCVGRLAGLMSVCLGSVQVCMGLGVSGGHECPAALAR